MPKLVLFTDLPDTEQSAIKSPGVHDGPMSGALMVYRDLDECAEQLRRWRQRAKSSLLPAFAVLADAKPINPPWESLADGVFSLEDAPWSSLGILVRRLSAGLERIEATDGTSLTDEERLLAFLTSRERHHIRPVLAANTKRGFRYPLAEAFLETSAEVDACSRLETMRKKGVLSAGVWNRLTTCRSCGSAQLNVRKVCGECGSPSLTTRPLIHHFPCGAVFPEDMSAAASDSRCPKCGKKLTHIGVDFDRPVSLDLCESCGSSSEGFPQQALCLGCGTSHHLNDCVDVDVYTYRVTDNAVSARSDGPSKPLELSLPDFSALTAAEEQRIGRSQSVGFAVLRVQLDRRTSASRERDVFEAISGILRSSDVIARTDDRAFLVMLRDTELAETVSVRLSEQIHQPGLEVTVERVVEGPHRPVLATVEESDSAPKAS